MYDAIVKNLMVRHEPDYQLLGLPTSSMATLGFGSFYSKEAFNHDISNVTQPGDRISQSNSISLSPVWLDMSWAAQDDLATCPLIT